MRIALNKKTGFRIIDRSKPVNIRDERGLLFYTTEPLLPRVEMFNLPAGTYEIDGGIRIMDKPVKYNAIPLPPVERNHPNPIGFDITFGDNPHKCTINFAKRLIFFDNSFKEKTLPEIYFVLYHEYAHQYYKTEKYADILASNYMLVKGFNPSQIARAHITSLSCRQLHRKKFNVEQLITANGNKA